MSQSGEVALWVRTLGIEERKNPWLKLFNSTKLINASSQMKDLYKTTERKTNTDTTSTNGMEAPLSL